MKVIKLMTGGKDMGIIRCMLATTADDDDEIVYCRRWLRQILVPSTPR